jgi:hypothetical protein
MKVDLNAARLLALRSRLDEGEPLVAAVAAVNEDFRPKPREELTEIVRAGEPHTVESAQLLCLKCSLAECNEDSRDCLIRIARRRDARLNNNITYQSWLGSLDEQGLSRRVQQQQDAKARLRERRNVEAR